MPGGVRGAPVKALTLWQPWASLIALGKKRYETRSWKPPLTLIGERIALHAAAKSDRLVRDACVELTPGADGYRITVAGIAVFADSAYLCTYPLGAVVGTATLFDVGRVIGSLDSGALRISWLRARPLARERNQYMYADEVCRESKVGYLAIGRYLWDMFPAGTKPFPIPARGRQGVWNWEGSPR